MIVYQKTMVTYFLPSLYIKYILDELAVKKLPRGFILMRFLLIRRQSTFYILQYRNTSLRNSVPYLTSRSSKMTTPRWSGKSVNVKIRSFFLWEMIIQLEQGTLKFNMQYVYLQIRPIKMYYFGNTCFIHVVFQKLFCSNFYYYQYQKIQQRELNDSNFVCNEVHFSFGKESTPGKNGGSQSSTYN